MFASVVPWGGIVDRWCRWLSRMVVFRRALGLVAFLFAGTWDAGRQAASMARQCTDLFVPMERGATLEVFGAVLLWFSSWYVGKMRGDSWSRLFVSPGESHVVVVVVVVLAMRVYLL